MKGNLLPVLEIAFAVTLVGCMHDAGSNVGSAGMCAKRPMMPKVLTHYESRDVFAKAVILETAKTMIDSHCLNIAGLSKFADQFYEVRCGDSGCDLVPRQDQTKQ